MVKIIDSTQGYLGGVLAPYSLCSILTDIPLACEAGRENDLSIAIVAILDSTNSTNLRT